MTNEDGTPKGLRTVLTERARVAAWHVFFHSKMTL
ncbi:hypothetical protein AZE42_13895 [Rhizopogon vesiculosus]|uniref:Uncharacterized protein n=1 Tax=Rhizopogon vesiculosus TaxID=180088 RepID=A0A1J8QHM9_9AGAM|nr:hypothetical protein AZE42_13895 [Rhizopogon vesiculosus]